MYAGPGVEVSLPLDRERETVWASQAQIVDLFGLNVSSVSRHINNIFRDSEVDRESNLQKVQIASSDRPVTFYSLDLILAVGYRANSSRAIQFRRWANEVLKDHLIKDITLNDRRLEQLGSIVQVLSRSDNEIISGVADVLASYVPGLRLERPSPNFMKSRSPIPKNFLRGTLIPTRRTGSSTLPRGVHETFNLLSSIVQIRFLRWLDDQYVKPNLAGDEIPDHSPGTLRPHALGNGIGEMRGQPFSRDVENSWPRFERDEDFAR